ncbi:hypothetical protein BDN72DRAFT_79286 [Pluteus cervinus]|uniref:Uncharacterized protein n=1 Tax=Pluteus cervinus TaxID=181527 RepID=A0ACD3B8V6_9AGAR|nr:hypothetical protein BDN72DRAFT_79286 [Pluteus cervinus]
MLNISASLAGRDSEPWSLRRKQSPQAWAGMHRKSCCRPSHALIIRLFCLNRPSRTVFAKDFSGLLHLGSNGNLFSDLSLLSLYEGLHIGRKTALHEIALRSAKRDSESRLFVVRSPNIVSQVKALGSQVIVHHESSHWIGTWNSLVKGTNVVGYTMTESIGRISERSLRNYSIPRVSQDQASTRMV